MQKEKNDLHGGKISKKPKQDIRIDLPTIGLKTIKQCRKVGLKGLVLKAKKIYF